MKSKIPVLLATLTLLFALSGCQAAPAEESTLSSEPSSEASETVSASSESSESSAESSQPEKDYTPILSLEDYPTVDGSTANLPLMALTMERAAGVEPDVAESAAYASTTAYAWRNLSAGNADLLLVYEAPDSVQEELQQGPELEVTAIGRDALVFIVNEQNPVQSLTQDQIRDIYTGAVTNWSELGGEDQEIVPFQRDEESGSFTLFKKLLIGDRDLTLLDPPEEFRPTTMGGLVEGLAEYNNAGNAIGYSVYYYISEMYAQPGLRLMAVDGVEPSYDSIASQEYPLLNEFYVAIRADEPEDSPARQLYNWILSEDGRQTVIDAGYVPVDNTAG